MTTPPEKYVVVVQVTKPGVKLDRMDETDENLMHGPPVIGGMYVYRYITARLGEKLKITIEPADGE